MPTTRHFFLCLSVAAILSCPADLQAQWTDAICGTEGSKYICVGINRHKGGAITALYTDWSPTANLVDNGPSNNDNGRQVQAAIYRQGEPYPQNCWPCNPGCFWGWNPVQAGSCSPSLTSGFYNLQKTPTTIFIQTQPRHWDTQLGQSAFYIGTFGTYYEIVSSKTLRITYQLWNAEAVSTGNAPHELPVVYLEPSLQTAKSYTGSMPFAYAPVTTIAVPPNSAVLVTPTERWTGWFNSSSKGVALYAPQPPYPEDWKMGRITAHSAPTHYMQNWAFFNLQPSTPYSRTVYLIVGTTEEIRDVVYDLEGY